MELSQYQEDGVEWIINTKRGILADKMGLGKTLQAIHAADRVCRNIDSPNVTRFCVIICKKPSREMWRRAILEAGVGATKDTVLVVDNKTIRTIESTTAINNKYRWIIVNYEQVDKFSMVLSFGCGMIIVDEAHNIVNIKTQRYRAIRMLALQSEAKQPNLHILFLTGTPTRNSMVELFAYLHMIDRKKYTTRWKWIDQYFKTTIEEIYPGAGRSTKKVGLPLDFDKFIRDHSQYILCRTWDDLRDKYDWVPAEPIRHVVPVDLHPEHRSFYDDLEDQWYAMLDNQVVTVQVAVALYTRLRQAAIDPALIFGNVDMLRGGKVDALIELIRDLPPDESVIVFSSFATAVKGLHARLIKEGISAVTYMGKAHSQYANQPENEKAFLSKRARVMIATIDSGSEGHNWQVANHVIFLDRAFSPYRNLQAEARAYRRGQQDQVSIYELVAPGVDERITEILRQKQQAYETTEALGAVSTKKMLEELAMEMRRTMVPADTEEHKIQVIMDEGLRSVQE